MFIPITLERKERPGADTWMIYELEGSAKFKAIKNQGKNPTLTELLYNQTEDEMVTITELLDSDV